MKPVFNILPGPSGLNNLNLLIEAGNYGISFSWFDHALNAMVGVQMYNFNTIHTPSEWISVLNQIYRDQPLLREAYHLVCFSSNFAETILVPGEFFVQSTIKELLSQVYQTRPTDIILTDMLKEEKLFNVYALPEDLYNFFQLKHNGITFSHSSSKEIRELSSESAMVCIVYHNALKVHLYSNHAILYSGIFEYTTPADMSYHLLKICKSYRIAADAIALKICGMIDEYSALYNEIYKYFLHVEFLVVNENIKLNERIKFYPSHFFCHQTILGTCAL